MHTLGNIIKRIYERFIMNNKDKPQLVFVDLLGLTAHSNFLTTLYLSCHVLVSQVCATENAIDWHRVLPECSKKPLYLSRGGFLKYSSWFFLLVIFISRRKNIFITGSTPIWHLIISIFASPLKVHILVHSEFNRIYSSEGIGNIFLQCIFFLYRLRNFKVAVMSNVMRTAIIKRRLYPEHLLHVITHPLPDIDSSVRFSKDGALNLIGFLRPQKLKKAEAFFSELKKYENTKIRVFGKYSSLEEILKLKPYCDDFEVKEKDYSSASERAFISRYDCYGVIFCPNEKYNLLTSGSVIDAVRFGCYCLMPYSTDMALELIGPLVINDLSERLEDPKKIIEDLIQKRKEKNFLEITNMFNY